LRGVVPRSRHSSMSQHVSTAVFLQIEKDLGLEAKYKQYRAPDPISSPPSVSLPQSTDKKPMPTVPAPLTTPIPTPAPSAPPLTPTPGPIPAPSALPLSTVPASTVSQQEEQLVPDPGKETAARNTDEEPAANGAFVHSPN
jgi:hypothetical protein